MEQMNLALHGVGCAIHPTTARTFYGAYHKRLIEPPRCPADREQSMQEAEIQNGTINQHQVMEPNAYGMRRT
eukprot:1092769-Amphidinium_carterae.2